MSDVPEPHTDPALALVERAWQILRMVDADLLGRRGPAILNEAIAHGLRVRWRMSHESYEDLLIAPEDGPVGGGPVTVVPDADRRQVVVRLFGIEVEPVRRSIPHVGRPDGTTGPAWDPRDLLELVIAEADR